MKNSIFLAVCMTVSFYACDQESDYLVPGDMQNLEATFDPMDGMDTYGILSQRNHCIELSTTHWLNGIGAQQPIREKAALDIDMKNVTSRRYRIEASGDAMSEVYARGYTELNLVYDTRTYRLTGTMTTMFYYGEILELKFDSDAQVRYERNSMEIKAKIAEATFKTEREEFKLDLGEASFIFPLLPEGPFVLTINTNTLLCEP